MRALHSIRLGLAALGGSLAVLAGASPAGAQEPAARSFTIVVRGTVVGHERVTVEQRPDTWTIRSSGEIGTLVLRNLQIRYDAAWHPLDLSFDAQPGARQSSLRTTVTGLESLTESAISGETPRREMATIADSAILLANPFVAPYAALAARLIGAQPGTTFAFHQPATLIGTLVVGESTEERIQTLGELVVARRTKVRMDTTTGGPIDLEIWSDAGGHLLRVSLPEQQTEMVREDLASVSSRRVTMSRNNDENVFVPANGFSLAGTLSKPATASTTPAPAVVLVGGTGATDRDETVAGVSIFGQLANALADSGFFVLRYDKRGTGQSGGRADAATLVDYADDAKAAVKFLSERKDVERRRIAVVGHGEGGWLALLAAKGYNRIAALGLLETVGVSGAELNIYQVTRQADRSNRSAAERTATIELQKQIQNAVITGQGWESLTLPPGGRAQADTPYFLSYLTLDPVKVMKDVDQPMLILQGALDREVPPASADVLTAAAKGRKRPLVETMTVPGVNHLLVPATSGERDEYGLLTDHQIPASVTSALSGWLQRTMPVRK